MSKVNKSKVNKSKGGKGSRSRDMADKYTLDVKKILSAYYEKTDSTLNLAELAKKLDVSPRNLYDITHKPQRNLSIIVTISELVGAPIDTFLIKLEK